MKINKSARFVLKLVLDKHRIHPTIALLLSTSADLAAKKQRASCCDTSGFCSEQCLTEWVEKTSIFTDGFRCSNCEIPWI